MIGASIMIWIYGERTKRCDQLVSETGLLADALPSCLQKGRSFGQGLAGESSRRSPLSALMEADPLLIIAQMLKQDEADLEKRRKAAIAKRVAEKEAKKHHRHAEPATTAPAPAPVRF